jgi:hypothetical protein
MTSRVQLCSAADGSHTRWRFVAIALTMPALKSAIGIDGGAIFQILAVEDLGLDPTAIGIAFAVGLISVPIQLMAARLPLWRARRQLQIFLALAAMQSWVLALLVAFDVAGEQVALLALCVTVLAEIGVSVLYAPAWQPLLRFALTSKHRQAINSRARAAGGVLVAATVILFGAAGDTLRTAIMVLVGAIAGLLALAASGLPAPTGPARRDGHVPSSTQRPAPLPAQLRPIYLVLGLSELAATWPLFLVYAHQLLWPTANLGVLAAVQLGGSLFAAATWRTTEADLASRATRACVMLVAAVAGLAAVRAPVTTGLEEIATVVALAAGAASAATIALSLLEQVHRQIDNETSVKALTTLDVVESSSLQLGLFLGGFLVSASAARAEWLVDPYRLYLLIVTILILLALRSLRSSEEAQPPRGRESASVTAR